MTSLNLSHPPFKIPINFLIGTPDQVMTSTITLITLEHNKLGCVKSTNILVLEFKAGHTMRESNLRLKMRPLEESRWRTFHLGMVDEYSIITTVILLSLCLKVAAFFFLHRQNYAFGQWLIVSFACHVGGTGSTQLTLLPLLLWAFSP